MYNDTTIIIPTLNEGKNISKIIKLIKKLYPKIEIIVSDDGSKDGTREKAKKTGAKVLNRSRKKIKGLTISVLDAVKSVKRKYIVVIDGDLQHPPKKIKDIIEKLRDGYDVVVGTRIKVEGNWPLNRKLISKVATFLGKLRLHGKFNCKDIMSGFFGVKTNLINSIKRNKFELQGYKVLFDLLKAIPKSKKIGEVNYIFGTRTQDSSKINKKHILIYFKSLFK